MTPSRRAQIKALFEQALDLAVEDRKVFLEEACAGDSDLRQEVESLLVQAEEASEFFGELAEGILPKEQPALGLSNTPDPLIGQRIAHYEVRGRLGGGGMGVVYKARDTKLDRMVALKFLTRFLSTDEQARRRFVQEAKAASALDHPNIGTIYEINEAEDGSLYIAMAYYAGETLKARIARGALPLEEALDYAIQMAGGLKGAHDAGIVHRDVKPANVIVTGSDSASPEGVVKILDFGLAKVSDVQLTKSESTMGTISYMSPEQARGEHVDHRSDIWSLGVVLYEMLTGERPFRGAFAEAIIYSILHEEPVPVAELRPDVPESLARVVHRLLEKDPDERFSNLGDVLEELLPILETLPRGMQILHRVRKALESRAVSVDPLDDLPPLPEGDLPPTPYRRLRRFTRKEAAVFFGRSNEIREVYKAITETKREPVILLYGESGVGKSSLLEAGVLPRLEQEHAVHYLRRERELGLSATLARALHVPDDAEAIKSAWHEQEQSTGRPLTIIMDQVEELYTRPMEEPSAGDVERTHNPSELTAFLGVLQAVFSERGKRPAGRLVLSFRKEWLADIEKRLEEASLPCHRIYLERLSREGIIEVVHGPELSERLQRKYNLSIEAGLGVTIASHLLSDRNSPIAPTLSILLAKMWELAHQRDEQPVFSLDQYLMLREKGILLDDFVAEQLSALQVWNPDAVSSGLVLDLLEYHTTDLDTAESRSLSDLDERYTHTGQDIRGIVEECQKKYFLITSDWIDEAGRKRPTSRLVHDALAPLVLQRYKSSDAPGQRARRILESRSGDWVDNKIGHPLDRWALSVVEDGQKGMRAWNPAEEHLIAESRTARSRRRQRQSALYVAGVVLVIASGLMYQLWNKYEVCSGPDAEWCRACIDSGGSYEGAEETDELQCIAGVFQGPNVDTDFVRIEPGIFEMGSESEGVDPDERPVHEVTISRAFYLGKTEVTQAQWYAVMGNNPSTFKSADRPVEHVSWNEVQDFLLRLNEQEGCGGCFRLPTEAEWEYAARAGTTTKFSFGDDESQLGDYAWHWNNSRRTTHPVGEKRPNPWGLYDMYGNVSEWVEDWYGEYPKGPVIDPGGPASGSDRVSRGGGWDTRRLHSIPIHSAHRHIPPPGGHPLRRRRFSSGEDYPLALLRSVPLRASPFGDAQGRLQARSGPRRLALSEVEGSRPRAAWRRAEDTDLPLGGRRKDLF